jgi:hypothetical protein
VSQQRLDRDEPIDLVRRIQDAEAGTEEQADALIDLSEANVPRPAASDLVFWPEQALGDDYPGRELTAEESSMSH